MNRFLVKFIGIIRSFLTGNKLKDSTNIIPTPTPSNGETNGNVVENTFFISEQPLPLKDKIASQDIYLLYKRSGVFYNPFRWVGRMILWTNGAVILFIILNIFIWFGYFLQSSREYQVVDLKKPLIVSAYESLGGEHEISAIDIKRQTCLILYAMHNYSYATPQNFELITGSVSPDIISNAEVAYNTNFEKMRDSAMVNSICITDFPLIGNQSKNGRINVIVKGYLLVFTQPMNSAGLPARTIPYRAELGFVVRPATHLTKGETLYLASITEVAGTSEASMFDEALSSKINLLK